MKKFSHLWLDDKGLKAFNAPVIDAPAFEDAYDNYNEALEQALDEGVYFKSDNDFSSEMITIFGYKIEKHKPYLVPDGYEVRTISVKRTEECDCEKEGVVCNIPEHDFIKYAILVPKEKPYSWIGNLHPKDSDFVKPQSIDEAAEYYYKTLTRPFADERGLVETAFVSGATSQAAKEYWYEQFKRDQK